MPFTFQGSNSICNGMRAIAFQRQQSSLAYSSDQEKTSFSCWKPVFTRYQQSFNIDKNWWWWWCWWWQKQYWWQQIVPYFEIVVIGTLLLLTMQVISGVGQGQQFCRLIPRSRGSLDQTFFSVNSSMKSSLYDSRDRSRSFTSIYLSLKRKVSRPPIVFAIFCKPFSRSSGESSLYDFRDRSRAFTSIISIFFSFRVSAHDSQYTHLGSQKTSHHGSSFRSLLVIW